MCPLLENMISATELDCCVHPCVTVRPACSVSYYWTFRLL